MGQFPFQYPRGVGVGVFGSDRSPQGCAISARSKDVTELRHVGRCALRPSLHNRSAPFGRCGLRMALQLPRWLYGTVKPDTDIQTWLFKFIFSQSQMGPPVCNVAIGVSSGQLFF